MIRDREIERLRRLQWTLHELAKPFADLKADILAHVLPKYLLYFDGRSETIYPPEIVEMLGKIDEMYQREAALVIKDFEDATALRPMPQKVRRG
jgi:hypothetical protein